MGEDWIGRWRDGRTGWYEEDGNAGLKANWPELSPGSRVLVPLCGNSPDLDWLAIRGYSVTGVEIAEVAVEGFFADRQLEVKVDYTGELRRYSAVDYSLEIFCGDYFEFTAQEFDALYDRGALVALSLAGRVRYVEHTKRLLNDDAVRMIVTLEYDQSIVAGPPFSVMPDELHQYWPDLERIEEKDDLPNSPPKFRKAGLTDVKEVVWLAD